MEKKNNKTRLLDRLTLDYDHHKEGIYRVLHALAYLNYTIGLDSYRVDYTKKGYHVVAWLHIAQTEEAIFRLREMLGDDPFRLLNDRIREPHMRQRLWSTKLNKKVIKDIPLLRFNKQ
jgi:hypothetical protein